MYVQDNAVSDVPEILDVSPVAGFSDTASHLPDYWDDPAYWKVSMVSRANALLVSLGRLWRARDRLKRLPTARQVRMMAAFDGREPCSHLVDEMPDYAPEALPDELDRQLGRHALRFTARDVLSPGQLVEMVVFPDGWGFDLT